MPNPTQFYSWTLPVEGQDPWFEVLDDSFASIDATVHSMESGLLSRATLVMSIRPQGSMDISSLTVAGSGTEWTVASVSPYGRCVGSFSLISSGAQIWTNLHFTGFASGTTQVFNNITGRARLIVSRTGISSLVIPNNSAWLFAINVTNTHMPIQPLTAITSLGPGMYSMELQFTAPGVGTDIASIMRINNDDFITLTIVETRL